MPIPFITPRFHLFSPSAYFSFPIALTLFTSSSLFTSCPFSVLPIPINTLPFFRLFPHPILPSLLIIHNNLTTCPLNRTTPNPPNRPLVHIPSFTQSFSPVMHETPVRPTAALFDAESEYQQVIDTINRIQNHGFPHKLSVPKMVIIGDQSSGKSSVLEALTKLSFPRDKDMCTRFATQVNLRRSPALDKDILSARIEGENDFNNLFSTIQSPMTFDGVIEQAVVVLCKRRNTDISDKVLEITLSGPTQTPLTIVDLPGFINTTSDGQDKSLPNTISGINKRYIQDHRQSSWPLSKPMLI